MAKAFLKSEPTYKKTSPTNWTHCRTFVFQARNPSRCCGTIFVKKLRMPDFNLKSFFPPSRTASTPRRKRKWTWRCSSETNTRRERKKLVEIFVYCDIKEPSLGQTRPNLIWGMFASNVLTDEATLRGDGAANRRRKGARHSNGEDT